MSGNIANYLSILGQGIVPTVELTVGGIAVATVDAFAAGIASRSRSRTIRFFVRVWVEGWRGSSELVQLFMFVYAVPVLIGLNLVPLQAGILVIGLNIGAYGAEIVRGALDAVPGPQREGAVALSLGPWQQLRLVLLPQSVVEMIPSFNTLFIQLVQATALASLILVNDITRQAKQVIEPTAASADMPLVWTIVLVLYLILSLILTLIMRVLERLAAHWAGRQPRPIPFRLGVKPWQRPTVPTGPRGGW